MNSYPQKVDVKSCAKTEPPHPCDPPVPCDPLKEPEGDCFPPFLCYERLKNPESPDHLTRCRSGASIGVRSCIKKPPPHPCDNPLPCCSFKNKKQQCNEPPLCFERIKNPELRKIRRVICTDSKGNVVERESSKSGRKNGIARTSPHNMNQKKCHVEPNPPVPPPSPCTLQKIKQKEAAGIKICPKEPVPDPPPAPSCLAVCIERLKNPPVPPSPNYPVACPVDRTPTGTARCDAIYEAEAAQPDLPWPGCPPQPPLPPPPEIDPCELQRIKEAKALCRERMKRYRE